MDSFEFYDSAAIDAHMKVALEWFIKNDRSIILSVNPHSKFQENRVEVSAGMIMETLLTFYWLASTTDWQLLNEKEEIDESESMST